LRERHGDVVWAPTAYFNARADSWRGTLDGTHFKGVPRFVAPGASLDALASVSEFGVRQRSRAGDVALVDRSVIAELTASAH
jgi:hypothetical protein